MKAAFPIIPTAARSKGPSRRVAAITVDDLRDFHRAQFRPRQPQDRGRRRDRHRPRSAPSSTKSSAIFRRSRISLPVAETEPAAPARVDIDMAIPQTVISFAGRGLKRADPDFIAATIATYILGGGSGSRALRGGARKARPRLFRLLGLAALRSRRRRLRRHLDPRRPGRRGDDPDRRRDPEIRQGGADRRGAAEAKSYLIGAYPIRFTTSTSIANQLLALQMDDLGIDYPQRRTALFKAVTIDDVRRVAQAPVRRRQAHRRPRRTGGELSAMAEGGRRPRASALPSVAAARAASPTSRSSRRSTSSAFGRRSSPAPRWARSSAPATPPGMTGAAIRRLCGRSLRRALRCRRTLVAASSETRQRLFRKASPSLTPNASSRRFCPRSCPRLRRTCHSAEGGRHRLLWLGRGGARHGPLRRAVAASAAIPVLFRPVVIDGRVLIDGGITNRSPSIISARTATSPSPST